MIRLVYRVQLILDRILMRCDFLKTLETIQAHFESKQPYTVDPHTAVGFSAAKIVASQK